MISCVHGPSGLAWWLLWCAWKPLGLGRGKQSCFRIVSGACRSCFVSWGTKQKEKWATGRDTLLQHANARTPWAVCQRKLPSEKKYSPTSVPLHPDFGASDGTLRAVRKEGCVQQDRYPPFSRDSQCTGPQKGTHRCREHCDLHLLQIPPEFRHYNFFFWSKGMTIGDFPLTSKGLKQLFLPSSNTLS